VKASIQRKTLKNDELKKMIKGMKKNHLKAENEISILKKMKITEKRNRNTQHCPI